MLVVNDERLVKRAEIIWEKGTNRGAFFRGEVNKYSWVDVGSSFLPSEIIAAFLYSQLQNMQKIIKKENAFGTTITQALMSFTNKERLNLKTYPKSHQTMDTFFIFYVIH